MHTSDAEKYNVADNEYVKVKVLGERGLIFDKVLCRVNKNYALEFHLDIDEGNASGLKNGVEVEIV